MHLEQNKLFIGNLSFDTKQEDLELVFKEFGEIKDIYMPMDADKRPRGFAFITYVSSESAQNALNANGQKINNREIRVSLARNRK